MTKGNRAHHLNIKTSIVILVAFMLLILAVTEYKKLFGGYVNIDDFHYACKNATKLYYRIPEGVVVEFGIPGTERMPRGSTIFSESLLHDRLIIVKYDKDGKKLVHSLRCVIDAKTRAAILVPWGASESNTVGGDY